MNKKITTTALLIMFLVFSMPIMAQDDYIDLNDYDLDLTIEQKNVLEEELSAIVDIYGEIDLGLIKIILGDLEEDEDLDDYEDDYEENSGEANFGRGLAQRIIEYKANNENWTGKGLSNMIHNYMENNHPGKGKGNNGNNPGQGNSNNSGKGNNPGKGN